MPEESTVNTTVLLASFAVYTLAIVLVVALGLKSGCLSQAHVLVDSAGSRS